MKTGILLTIALLGAPLASAYDLVADQSTLTVTSIKSGSFAENHSFSGLTGSLQSDGGIVVSVPLDSIWTGIGIRDERMRKYLFDVANNPASNFIAKVMNMSDIAAMKVGGSLLMTIDGEFALNSAIQNIPVAIRVTKQTDHSLRATTVTPVIINAAAFGYVDGIAKLQELAGLPSIATAVPVTFSIVFSD
jgi:hypothetical protein